MTASTIEREIDKVFDLIEFKKFEARIDLAIGSTKEYSKLVQLQRLKNSIQSARCEMSEILCRLDDILELCYDNEAIPKSKRLANKKTYVQHIFDCEFVLHETVQLIMSWSQHFMYFGYTRRLGEEIFSLIPIFEEIRANNINRLNGEY